MAGGEAETARPGQESAAVTAAAVTAAIQETLRAYEQIEITAPSGDTFTVRPVYWTNENPHDSADQAAADAAALPKDQRERRERQQRNREARWDRHQQAVATLGGTDRVPRSVLQRVRNGKATPDELRQFIQAAVSEAAEGERRRASLPRAPRSGAAGDWESNVRSWISRYGIGLDSSMFVFEAERRVREDLHGAEAAEAWAAQWTSRPGGRALSSGADPIATPSDLQPGDIMRTPDTSES